VLGVQIICESQGIAGSWRVGIKRVVVAVVVRDMHGDELKNYNCKVDKLQNVDSKSYT
jgi:hypothetical protein